MARRSLRPEMNRIRGWVRQGRTDAWIAHQLEVTVQQIQSFKREQGLAPETDAEGQGAPTDYDDEIDLRAEDDALIAAELDAAEADADADATDTDATDAERPGGEDDDDGSDSEEGEPRSRRRRGRRGGRRRRRTPTTLEATFDHGEEGYGLWLDPAIQDDPVYAEYWAGHRPLEVVVEENQIVLRRAGGEESDDGE